MGVRLEVFKLKVRKLSKAKYSWIVYAALIIVVLVVIPVAIVLSNLSNFADTLHRPYNTDSGADIPLSGDFTFSGVVVTLPKGFYVTGGTGYQVARNNLSADMIVFTEDAASLPELYTKDLLYASTRARQGESAGEVLDYKAYKIGDRDVVLYRSTYKDADQYYFYTTCYIFFPDKTLRIMYREYSDRYTDAFARSIETIRLKEDKT